jgi:hypothetical protein
MDLQESSFPRNKLQITGGLLTCCRCEKKRAGNPGALLELVNVIFVKAT